MHRRLLDQRDVADAAAARQCPFEQIVAEHLALGQTPTQHGMYRSHMQQPLASEAALLEQVLVDLGTGRAVGVHTALAGKQPVVGRGLVRLWQRRD